MNRICAACKKKLDTSMFPKNKNEVLGIGYTCISCKNEKYNEFYHTKKGVSGTIYNAQKQNSKRRGHTNPAYSLSELRQWLYSQPLFHVMYDNWKRLDYQKAYKPSVDRIDDSIGYTMANIQLMTWDENLKKHKKQLMQGEAITTHVPVYQLDLEGNIVGEFYSINEASRVTGAGRGNIFMCCNGKRKKSGGFGWKHKNKG